MHTAIKPGNTPRLVAALFAAIAIVGCTTTPAATGAPTGTPGTAPGTPAATQATQIETVEPGVISVAFPGDWPMSSLAAGGASGFDGDMVTLMAERLGLGVKPLLMEFSAGIEAVSSGRADMLIGAIGWSAERAEVMYLTDEIYYIQVGVAQLADRNIQSWDDMEGLVAGTVTGYSIIPEVELAPIQELKLYDNADSLLRDVAEGRIDFGVANPFLIEAAAVKNPSWGIKSLPILVPDDRRADAPVTGNKVLYIMAVNKDRQALGMALDEQIRALWASCETQEIVEQYINADESFWTPPEDNRRVGVDRLDGYEPPTLGSCG